MPGARVRRLAADLASLSQATEFVLEGAREARLPAERVEHVALMVEEIFANITSYAYAEGQSGIVEIRLETPEPGFLCVEVADCGAEFNPLTLPDPDLPPAIEQRAVGGLGIFLVKQLAEVLEYRRDDGWNRLRFRVTSAARG